MNVPGIYRITITRPDGCSHYYIGQSINVRGRMMQHFNHLKNGKCKNAIMQAAFDKYGKSAFSFELLEQCERDKSALAVAEKRHFEIQIMNTGSDSLYNICRETMVSVLGVKRSKATKMKMSVSAKNRPPMSDETRRKISETKRVRGQRPSAEHMAILRELATGRPKPPHAIAAAVASNLGKKKSSEEIACRTETRRFNASSRGKDY